MNNQLKLLLYIVFLVGAFFLIQDNFGLLNVSFVEEREVEKESDGLEGEVEMESEEEVNFVEVYVDQGEVIRVDVEVADTDVLRTLGLSNRKYLGDYNGMLFLFDEKVSNPFWMKDTLIDLDIIFIDEKGFIVDIKEENEPCRSDFCPQILSSESYKYVLEVNGGFCQINGVRIGQSIVFHLASSS